MKEDLQLKLQAYLDGELPATECPEVEALLAQDANARALLAELRNTSSALKGYEADLKLSESRDFYWSKIRRAISQPVTGEPVGRLSLGAWLRRILVPAGAFAAITIAVLLALPQPKGSGASFTDVTDSVAFTYHNYDTGATLVWLDYPAENDVATPNTDDTLDL